MICGGRLFKVLPYCNDILLCFSWPALARQAQNFARFQFFLLFYELIFSKIWNTARLGVGPCGAWWPYPQRMWYHAASFKILVMHQLRILEEALPPTLESLRNGAVVCGCYVTAASNRFLRSMEPEPVKNNKHWSFIKHGMDATGLDFHGAKEGALCLEKARWAKFDGIPWLQKSLKKHRFANIWWLSFQEAWESGIIWFINSLFGRGGGGGTRTLVWCSKPFHLYVIKGSVRVHIIKFMVRQ